MYKILKPEMYIVQFKNPKTKRWKNYAITYTKQMAELMIIGCRAWYNLEWRMKKHK